MVFSVNRRKGKRVGCEDKYHRGGGYLLDAASRMRGRHCCVASCECSTNLWHRFCWLEHASALRLCLAIHSLRSADSKRSGFAYVECREVSAGAVDERRHTGFVLLLVLSRYTSSRVPRRGLRRSFCDLCSNDSSAIDCSDCRAAFARPQERSHPISHSCRKIASKRNSGIPRSRCFERLACYPFDMPRKLLATLKCFGFHRLASLLAWLHQSQLVQIPKPVAIDLRLKQGSVHVG
jgi:hypothetical protein